MKISIRRQFALIFIGLMAGTIFICVLVNTVFLSKYYMHNKTKVIYDAYATIAQAANSDSYGTYAFAEELDQICSNDNITIYIMDANSQVRYVSVNGGKELENKLMGYIFGRSRELVRVLEQGEDYRLQLTGSDGNEHLEMFGRLSTGVSFIMSTPVESIRESAKIGNRFFAYVGIVATLAGGMIIWLVSRKITKPILELNQISERMVKLDFDAKYKGGSVN
ncbi:MAG: two-component sensor histidine kinase, partial [Acetatifactor sp.]|nr:two-component sensor histidine kinase [Acetatifactor sp.]